ncbi:uncharacterized protein LOC125206151 [Salvia hispanica]|uniref:uncharacterized protein LOC125206151 n=1 Tax=Salvia hispanica TaxID=49212 RepID=UPI002009B3A7|nr:uncharacterized protein LOC125206151 [Salvia hispanica]
MSIFVWRLLSNRVHVDTKLQWRKIELASKCYCCPTTPGIESLQHLFVNGVGAARVWSFFDQWFAGGSYPLKPKDTIPERLEGWAKRTNQQKKTHMSRITPCLIVWFLWAERNRCRHNEADFRPQNVIWQTQLHIKKLIDSGQLGTNQRRGVVSPLTIVPALSERRQAQLVMPLKWHPPDPPWIKLNTASWLSEGSGQARGGGIIRDHYGQLLCAFSVPLLVASSLEASAKTVRIGLSEAKELGTQIWIETNDPRVASLVKTRSFGPADSRHEMARLFLLQKGCSTRITSIGSVLNKAAKCLAKLQCDPTEHCRFNSHTAPRIVKAIVRLEQMGVPYLREEDE